MNIRKIRPGFVLMALVVGILMLVPLSSIFAQSGSLTDIPIVGRGPAGSRFVGTLDVTEFVQSGNNQVAANGVLNGELVDRQGNVIRTVTDLAVQDIPVRGYQNATCQILSLTLGPLDLNLLGLRVQLSKIDLLITAQQGGGLLGNLLCSLADLGGGSGVIGQIVGLLNNILAALG